MVGPRPEMGRAVRCKECLLTKPAIHVHVIVNPGCTSALIPTPVCIAQESEWIGQMEHS